MPDPDIEIRRGGGLRKAGGGRSQKKIFFGPWSKNKWGRGGGGILAPPLDPPLVYSLEHVLLTGEVLE